MEIIGGRDNDRVHIRVGQHRVIVEIALARQIGVTHAFHQVPGDIADRMEIGIAGLHGRLKMRKLRDGAAAENTGAQPAVLFLRHRSVSAS